MARLIVIPSTCVSSSSVAANRVQLASATAIAEGRTLKFRFKVDGISREGFLARFQGKLLAYENVCCHLPVPLDYGDGQFFDAEGAHFVCQTHGAVYEPSTGKCVRGPCTGASLKPLPIEVDNGVVWLKLTEQT